MDNSNPSPDLAPQQAAPVPESPEIPQPAQAPSDQTGPTQDHWALLSATRFSLAMIVFIGHLGATNHPVTRLFWEFGELAAVVSFFIISGYSIAHSIQARPRGYIMRRIWRIWPTYLFAFLVCTIPVALILPTLAPDDPYTGHPVTTWQIVGNLFMLQGLLVPVIEANAATWTLAIEEFYYLLAPLFRKCALPLLIGIIVVSSLLYYFSWTLGFGRFAGQNHGVSHISFIWAWLAGFVFYQHRDKTWALAMLILLPAFLMGANNQLGGKLSGFTLAATGIVIAFGGSIKLPNARIRQFLVFLGNISFPLYIIHSPLFFILYFTRNTHAYLFDATVVFLFCIVVYYLIDRPNRDNWKFFVKPQPATSTPGHPLAPQHPLTLNSSTPPGAPPGPPPG